MATDSIMGLFASPEQIQQAQYDAVLKRNVEMAQLTPMQRGLAQLGTASYMLGGAIGSALGAEDPMLKLATARKQIMSQVDQTDPQSLAQAAQALNQAGDVQGARALAMAAQEAAVKQSQVTKNLREAKTTDQRNYEAAVNQGYRGTLQDFMLAQRRAGATQIGFSPEIKMTDKELGWRGQYLAENKPVIEQAANVQQALGLLQQSQQSPFADAAFNNTVVSAFGGDKQKSKAEIDRLVKAGSLDERVANTVKGFFEGTTSAKTKEDQLKVLTAVDKVLEQRYNNSAQSWTTRLSKAGVNPDLVVPGYREVVGGSAAVKSAALPPEGTRLRNKTTGKIEVVRNGKLVPE